MKSKVYFTKNITSENLIKLFDALNVKLDKEVAIKLHSGEDGNQNYIKPEIFKPFIDYIDGTVVDIFADTTLQLKIDITGDAADINFSEMNILSKCYNI